MRTAIPWVATCLALGLAAACSSNETDTPAPATGTGTAATGGSSTGGGGSIPVGGRGGTTASAGTGGAGASTSSGGSGGLGGSAVDCDSMSDDCASEFGSLFTQSNGRADGTLVALLQTTDTQCALFNSDHVVLQVSMLGQVQRLVVSVDGVAVTTVSAPLVGPAFTEGWNTDVVLDYVTDLGVHSADFTSVSMADAESFLCEHLRLGEPVSVYAYAEGTYPASAHQIHRNDNYPDGAIVAGPTTDSPLYLLFRYDTQTF